MIDVIIPVYRGLAPTRRCLESVLESHVDVPHEVIVIDDASPEPDISAWLKQLSEAGRITLVTHASNAGFVASANEGMGMHPDRDVVLLNSDTEVADGWLDGLAACAARESGVGTVTPFSNNATICSYPHYPDGGPMPNDCTVEQMARLLSDVNAGLSVEIPTGVGFCLFIRRACLNDIGAFDEAAFGKGYGEEVDFCLRASRGGWRHYLAADVFVFHEGSVSFTPEAASERKREAQKIVDERFPGFREPLATFFQRDPARLARRQAGLARLRASHRPKLLFLTHGWGGGVARHIDDIIGIVSDAASVLLLRPGQPGGPEGVQLSWVNADDTWEAFFPIPGGWGDLITTLRGIGVARVHLHHTHRLPEAALSLATALGAPLDVTLHDYLTVCPQHNLADASGRYCGEPDANGCNRCIAERPHAWDTDIAAWRSRWGALMRSADRIWAPSHDLARRLRQYHPAVNIEVMPHPEAPSPRVSPPTRVLVPGGLSPIKGLETVSRCATDASARRLPIFFRVLGHLAAAVPVWPEVPLSVSGTYPEGRLPELIALERGDVVFLASQVPESYSYTLTAALESGLPIVAMGHGAFVERLEGRAMATLLPPGSSPAEINAALLHASAQAAIP